MLTAVQKMDRISGSIWQYLTCIYGEASEEEEVPEGDGMQDGQQHQLEEEEDPDTTVECFARKEIIEEQIRRISGRLELPESKIPDEDVHRIRGLVEKAGVYTKDVAEGPPGRLATTV
jgi:hypothetical protein